ncbi:MAG: hypothetical protein AAF223_19290, partial [Bacteroidota bacterium]
EPDVLGGKGHPFSSCNRDNSFPTETTIDEASLRAVTYYDDYAFPHASESDFAFVDELESRSYYANMKGEVTGTMVKNLSDNSWLKSISYFDEQYRPIYTVTENHLGGTDRLTLTYENAVRNEVTVQLLKHSTSTENHTIREEFTYDHVGRLLSVTHQVDTDPVVTIAAHQYNALGELTQKQLHGSGVAALQTVDYRYHIRGWLEKINELTDTEDYFAQEFYYEKDNHNFNGNIREVVWKQAGSPEKRYTYTYDAADQLTGAQYSYRDGTGTWTSGAYQLPNVSYDGNGNITALKREGAVGGLTKILDDLTYSYQGNQLVAVDEQNLGEASYGFIDGASTTTEYQYDAAGNLTRDDNKGVTGISYDPLLNLPLQVTINGQGTIQYTYDAAGTRLSQTIRDTGGNIISSTDYVGVFEYQ